MQVWNVLLAARCKCRTQKIAISHHHRTTLSGYIFASKTCIDSPKKNLLSSSISSTCPHNMLNFGPLAAEIGPVVWGTPANFNGFCVLAALLYGTTSGRQPNFSALNRGATYIRQGGHHVGHWPTFLVNVYFVCLCIYWCMSGFLVNFSFSSVPPRLVGMSVKLPILNRNLISTVLQPLHRSTCVSWHARLST